MSNVQKNKIKIIKGLVKTPEEVEIHFQNEIELFKRSPFEILQTNVQTLENDKIQYLFVILYY